MGNRKILWWLVGVVAFVILAFFLLNLYVKNKLTTQLSNLDEPVEYQELGVNLLLNNFSMEEVQTRQGSFGITAQKVNISGLSYYRFLVHDQINIGAVEIDRPQIILFPQDSTINDTAQKRQIKLRSLLLKNGTFSRKDSDTSEIDLHVQFPEVELKGIENAEDLEIDSYRASLDSVYIRMNAEHFIDIGNAEAEDGRINFSDFRIVPYDSKAEFDRKLPYEKDRISLQVSNISFENFAIGEQKDTLLLTDSKMIISDAFLEIYRNKLLKDDERRKPLYNELLREAPVKLDIEQILVENSEIIYEEQVQEGREAAVIRFTDVSAEVKNLSNLRAEGSQQPEITANASFMRGTPVHLNWTFPVFEAGNNFNISGGFGALEGEALDPFLVPALDLQARGDITSIDFNFRGNENTMAGTFTLNYDELEVELLREEGEEKRSFLSAIANLFVRNEAEPEPEDESIGVVRDKQRSFWNYVWLGLREGFMETVSRL